MSFFTSLVYYNPGPPPPITAGDICSFIGHILDLGIVTNAGLCTVKVKFGNAIDQDDLGTSWEEETVPGVAMVREIDWDIEERRLESPQQIIDRLPSEDRRLYRAHIAMGTPCDEILRPITRINSPENEVGFCPDTFSLGVGPINIYALSSEDPVNVGWLGMSISGPGYLYPWTLRDTVIRLEASPKVRQLTNLCRTTWPVKATKPEEKIVNARREFRELWPYDEFDRPWDWYWGVMESG